MNSNKGSPGEKEVKERVLGSKMLSFLLQAHFFSCNEYMNESMPKYFQNYWRQKCIHCMWLVEISYFKL